MIRLNKLFAIVFFVVAAFSLFGAIFFNAWHQLYIFFLAGLAGVASYAEYKEAIRQESTLPKYSK
jgi:hypothetical protein